MITRDIATITHAISEISFNATTGIKGKSYGLPYAKYAREVKHYCLVLLITALDICRDYYGISESDYSMIRESIFKAKSIEAGFDETFYNESDEM
jgi:hypothetical protein